MFHNSAEFVKCNVVTRIFHLKILFVRKIKIQKIIHHIIQIIETYICFPGLYNGFFYCPADLLDYALLDGWIKFVRRMNGFKNHVEHLLSVLRCLVSDTFGLGLWLMLNIFGAYFVSFLTVLTG